MTPTTQLKENTENFLNFKIRKTHQIETEEWDEKLYNFWITVPADEHQEETFYQLRICSECGETQAMNFEAFRKRHPQEAKQILEEKRREEAEKFIKTGEQPKKDERIKKEIEQELLEWDNNRCETRHPAR